MKIKTKEELIKWFASSLYTYRCIHINEFLDSCTKNENGDICVTQEQRATLYEEYDDLSGSVKDTFRLISKIYINGIVYNAKCIKKKNSRLRKFFFVCIVLLYIIWIYVSKSVDISIGAAHLLGYLTGSSVVAWVLNGN